MKNLYQHKEITILILTFLALFFCLQGMIYSSDTLFPFRYAGILLSGDPYGLLVQAGPRFFPDVFYALVSNIFTKNTLVQTTIVYLLNIILLCVSAIFLFSEVFKNKKLAFIFTSFILILLPVIDVFKLGSVRFNLFAPGIHGFAIPFQLLIFALTIKFLDKKELSFLGWISYFLIGAICGINDSLFIPSTIVPVCFGAFIVWLVNKNQFSIKNVIIFILCNFAIVLVTLLATKVLNNLFDQIHFLSTSDKYFGTSFAVWLNEGAKHFFDQFLSLRRTQGLSYLVLLSILISIVFLRSNFKNNSRSLLFLNCINIIWLPLALLSMWAIDKNLLRYVPHILLISPIIILINFHQIINNHLNKTVLVVFLLIISFALHLTKHRKHYQTRSSFSPNQHHSLMTKLSQLRESGVISENGLSDYWVAWSSTQEYGFNIPAINNTGVPYVFVSDALAYWNKSDGQLAEVKYTFVVNSYNKPSKSWVLDERQLIKNYGRFHQKISFKDDYRRKFLIYVYENGINSNYLYDGAHYTKDFYFSKN